MENYRIYEIQDLPDSRAVGDFSKNRPIEPKQASLFIALGLLLQESLIFSIDCPWFDHFYQSILKLTSQTEEILTKYIPAFVGWQKTYQSYLQRYFQSKKSKRALKSLKKYSGDPQYLTLFSVMAKAFLISLSNEESAHKIANDQLEPEEYRSILEPLCACLGINILLVLDGSPQIIRGSQQGPLLAIMASREDGVSILYHNLRETRESNQYPYVLNFDDLPEELSKNNKNVLKDVNPEILEKDDPSKADLADPREVPDVLDVLVRGFQAKMVSEEECRSLIEVLKKLEMNEAAQTIQLKLRAS